MLVHPQFNPVAVALGPLQIHWYGLMYLAAFLMFMLLARRRAALPWYAQAGWQPRDVEDLLFYGVLGVVLGGRIGYVLFYKPGEYLANPLAIFEVWKGGMAFHGGMLGVIVAMWVFARVRGRRFFEVTDLIAPCVPPGLAAGRLGNFINGELWGRVALATLPWAMVFPQAGDGLPRHPSQLYQLLLEGPVLMALMVWYSRQPRACGQVSAMFLLGYGLQRFVAEFFREPDAFLGTLGLGLSMGQWLCVPMIASGGALLWHFGRLNAPAALPSTRAPLASA